MYVGQKQINVYIENVNEWFYSLFAIAHVFYCVKKHIFKHCLCIYIIKNPNFMGDQFHSLSYKFCWRGKFSSFISFSSFFRSRSSHAFFLPFLQCQKNVCWLNVKETEIKSEGKYKLLPVKKVLGIDILHSLLNHEGNQFICIESVSALMRSMLLVCISMYAFGKWIMIHINFLLFVPLFSNS